MKLNSRRFVALSGRVLRATLLGLALATILLTGGAYYQHEKTVVCERADAWLAAMTDTKAAAIANWLHERRGDAEEIFASELLVGQLAQALTTPNADHSALAHWLNNFQQIYGYERITLFDAHGTARLSAPGGGSKTLVADAEVRAAFASRQIILADLHREADDEVRMALLMPVRADRSATDQPANGVLAFFINPERDLYPLVQSWPTRLASAESLLVRREGNDLLYLNELRYRLNSALNYRVPLTHTNGPAVRLMLGDTNVLAGVDYRGVRVRASGQRIANSPWGLVTKVDEAELLVPLRREAWYIAGLSGLLMTLVVGAMLLMSRQQRVNTFRRQLELEWQHQESQHQVRALFDNSLDGVLITSPEGRIHAANPAACRLLHLTEAEIIRRGRAGLVEANDPRLAPLLQQRAQTGQAKGELRFLRGDGTAFEAELSCTNFETKAGPRAGIIFRDLTARRQLEENLRASVRCRTTISACNRELVRAQAEPELLQRICDVIIQHGGYRMVWVGFAQADESKTIRIGASAGHEVGYLTTAKITWAADDERGRGPSGLAFRTGETVVCNNFQTDPCTGPWRAEAVRCGYASSISLPLKNAGTVFGVMMIYSQQIDAFTADEISLLTELADDLAYGIHHLRTRVEREQMETALQASEKNFRELVATMQIGLVVHAPDTSIRFANPKATELLGLTLDQLRGKTATDPAWYFLRMDGSRLPLAEFPVAQLLRSASGKIENIVLGIVRPDRASPTWVQCEGYVGHAADGAVTQFVITFSDITARHVAEQSLKLFRTLVDQSNDAFEVLDPATGRFLDVNEQGCANLGYTWEEFVQLSVFDVEVAITPDAFQAVMAQVRERGGMNWSGTHRRKDGSTFPVSVSLKYVQLERPYLVAVVHDETARQQAEAALRASEQDFRSLAEAVPQIVWATRPDGWNIYFNQQWVDYTGMSLAESYGHGWNKPFHPDDQQRAWDAWQNAVQNHAEYSLECQLRRADGVYQWWLIRGEPMCAADGQIIKWFGTCTNIETLKQTEATLAEERIRLQTLVQNLPLAVYLKDTQHRKILANPTDVKYLGAASEADVLGKTDFDFFPPTEAAQTHAEERQILATGEPLLNHEEKLTRPDGSVQWILTSKVPLTNAAGQVVGLVGLGLNITDKKLAEQTLADERRLLRTLVDSLPVSVYLKDTAGRKILANKFNRETSGTEVIGKTDFELYRPEDAAKFNADDQQVFQTGQPLFNVEELHHQPDGSQRWVLTSKVPLLDADGQVTGLVGIGLDITEKKAVEQALRRQTEELQARNDELNRFNRLAVGRELRMIELKREINELCQKLAVPPRHKIATAAEATSAQKDSP